MKSFKIGIPRALLFHKYGVLWLEFFKNLGIDVVLSPETNKEIISNGVNSSVDESCLSIKIFAGHINWLAKNSDYIFLPHYEYLYQNEEICVKFMGLNDIVRNSFPGIKMIEYTVNAKNVFKNEWLGLIWAGTKLTGNPIKSAIAYIKANKKFKNEKIETIKHQEEKVKNRDKAKPLILIVSHPYTAFDNFLGKPISKFLKNNGAEVIYSDAIDIDKARDLSKSIAKDLYWSFHKELVGAVEYYKNDLDGIIFLVTFPCGPDSLVVNLCQLRFKNLPSILLTLDELQAEAGMKTRLESFIDILKIKKHGEN